MKSIFSVILFVSLPYTVSENDFNQKYKVEALIIICYLNRFAVEHRNISPAMWKGLMKWLSKERQSKEN